ncbi:MAG: arylsulfatase [Planctomycetota bacterium]
MRRASLVVPLAVALALALVACGATGERATDAARDRDPRPNIVFVLADDLGWGELGCYGQELIPTPNVDRLAAHGMRFTQHYAGSAVCAPSRCVLLTGLHTGHAYVRNNTETGGMRFGPDAPEGQTPLPAGTWTIARELRDAGYRTGFVGKWGLGGPEDSGHPLEQGFDRFYGILCQRKAHGYYPTHLWSDREKELLAGNDYLAEHQRIDAPLATEAEYFERFCGTTYAPDRLIEEAVRFVEDSADRPFFLEYASPIPHVALQVPPTELDAFPREWDGEAMGGGPYLGDAGYVPQPRPRAAYAAMIARLDRDVGLLLDALERAGVLDDTLFVFSSDNGATFNGGTDAAFFDSVGGLRGLKGSLFEGGVRVPFVVSLPGRVARGSVSDFPSGFQDFAATALDLAGLPPREGLDGVSLVPVFEGRGAPVRTEPLYFELGNQQAVRVGRFKAVRRRLGKGDLTIELFDLEADPDEERDVAGEHPDVVRRMAETLAHARVPSAVFPSAALDR